VKAPALRNEARRLKPRFNRVDWIRDGALRAQGMADPRGTKLAISVCLAHVYACRPAGFIVPLSPFHCPCHFPCPLPSSLLLPVLLHRPLPLSAAVYFSWLFRSLGEAVPRRDVVSTPPHGTAQRFLLLPGSGAVWPKPSVFLAVRPAPDRDSASAATAPAGTARAAFLFCPRGLATPSLALVISSPLRFSYSHFEQRLASVCRVVELLGQESACSSSVSRLHQQLHHFGVGRWRSLPRLLGARPPSGPRRLPPVVAVGEKKKKPGPACRRSPSGVTMLRARLWPPGCRGSLRRGHLLSLPRMISSATGAHHDRQARFPSASFFMGKRSPSGSCLSIIMPIAPRPRGMILTL